MESWAGSVPHSPAHTAGLKVEGGEQGEKVLLHQQPHQPRAGLTAQSRTCQPDPQPRTPSAILPHSSALPSGGNQLDSGPRGVSDHKEHLWQSITESPACVCSSVKGAG